MHAEDLLQSSFLRQCQFENSSSLAVLLPVGAAHTWMGLIETKTAFLDSPNVFLSDVMWKFTILLAILQPLLFHWLCIGTGVHYDEIRSPSDLVWPLWDNNFPAQHRFLGLDGAVHLGDSPTNRGTLLHWSTGGNKRPSYAAEQQQTQGRRNIQARPHFLPLE